VTLVPTWLKPKSITAQITTLVVSAVVIGVLLTAVVLTIVAGGTRMRMNPEAKAASEAARIATVVRQAQIANSPSALNDVLSSVQMPGTRVRLLPSSAAPARPSQATEFTGRVAASLRSDWRLSPTVARQVAGWSNVIAIDIGAGRALLFEESQFQAIETFLTLQAVIALSLIFIIVLALSVYAIRSVTKPLSAMADAARAFGRSADDDRPLDTRGPAEISQVAVALNDMRTRVRLLVDERTRMLAAISHDLRTPLTRLRLRSERVTDGAAREHMLGDIAAIDAMIGETLAYLRDGGSSELVELVDLPSLLQTICGEFSDLGHEVIYEGPSRFSFGCRAGALARAVTNVVDNGVKHGSKVTVTLGAPSPSTARIDIADDGPGIPPGLREKAFEPFFKADSARSASRSGFGLGLSIARDIVERHGGSITLADNTPCGLLVRMSLDAHPDARPALQGARATSVDGSAQFKMALPRE
jgi:signal transduction histidine kinase